MNKRIVLKKTERDDAQHRAEVLNQADVSKNVFINVPVSISATERWTQSINDNNARVDFTVWNVEGSSPSRVGYLGLVAINQLHGTAELYVFLDPRYQNLGIGSEALQLLIAYSKYELNLRKIKLYISEPNRMLDKFYGRNGFEKEGELKDDVWFRGRYVNRSIYSIFTEQAKLDAPELYAKLC